MEERKVDVAIIGAGTSGLNAMGQARRAGKSFVLINGGELGTTCARVGCMPSKAFIQVAEDFHRRSVFSRHAIEGGEDLSLDIEEAMEHVRDMRDSFVDRVLSSSTDNLPEELIVEGRAEFLEPTLLQVGEEKIRAEKVVIATGSRPIVPAAWEAFGDKIITSDEIFELEELPGSCAVIGLGVIGLELGQALNRYGVEVTGIDQLNTIGGLTDPEVAKSAIETIGREFPLWLGEAAEITEEGEQLRITAGDNSVLVDKVLASMGRRPNVDNMGLERLNIELDERGVPVHNPNTLQIGDLPIFIAGDVTNHRPILHEAGRKGRAAGFNAAHDDVTAFREPTMMAIVFSDPNIAFVGKMFAELDPETTAVGGMPMAPVGRALIMAKNRGLIRVYADKQSGKLLGAEMACVKGESLAHLLCWAIEQELSVWDVLRMPFYHPVIEEALQAALYNLAEQVENRPEGPIELTRMS